MDKIRAKENENVAAPKIPPMPSNSSVLSEKILSPAEPLFKKKDELWTAFRGLDAEFQK